MTIASVTSARSRTLLFVGAALAINTIDAMAIRTAAGSPSAAWVGAAAVVDLVGVVTLLYWGLLVRPGLRGRTSMAVVAGVSTVRAALLLPTPLSVKFVLAGLLEAGVVAALGWAVWSARARIRSAEARAHAPDLVDTLHGAAARLIPVPAVAGLVATELAALACATGMAPGAVPPHVRVFPMVRRSGLDGLAGVLTLAGLIEIAVLHVLLSHWHPAAAWIVTAAGAYGLIYLRGLTRAIARRPVLVTDDEVTVRYGLTFRLTVPCSAIAAIEPATGSAHADVVLPRRRAPAWRITLDAPREARGLFGRRRMVRTLAITLDDDAAFGRAVADVIARRTARPS